MIFYQKSRGYIGTKHQTRWTSASPRCVESMFWNPLGILRRFLLETMGFLLGSMLVVLCFFLFFSVGVSVQRLQSSCFKYVQMDWVCNMIHAAWLCSQTDLQQGSNRIPRFSVANPLSVWMVWNFLWSANLA